MTIVLRLLFRQHRFEMGAVVIGLTVLAGLALIAAYRLDEARPTVECLASWRSGNDEDEACSEEVAEWLGLRADEAFRLFGFASFLSGILMGAGLIARELEHGTAQLGWSLSGSRGRWMTERVVPLAIVLLLGVSAVAIAADFLEVARQPGIDSRQSFHEYGSRGMPLVARAFSAYGVCVLAGCVVGRQLPSLILGGVLVLAVAYGLGFAFPYGATWDWASESDIPTAQEEVADSLRTGGFRDRDGVVLSYREAVALAPHGVDAVDWIWENFDVGHWVLRGSRAGEVERTETLALGGLGVIALTGAWIVVSRRRPY